MTSRDGVLRPTMGVAEVELPGRGRLRYWTAGSKRNPPLLLLHGWTVNSMLNFGTLVPHLASRWYVVTADHQGHGGVLSCDPFSLETCASDSLALIEALGLGPTTVLGYSMGGSVALLMARKRPERVAGVVLCATAASFGQWWSRGLLGALGMIGSFCHRATSLVAHPVDVVQMIHAAQAIRSFDARPWLCDLQVPAAVVATSHDRLVGAGAQLALATAIPGARLFAVHGGHDVCVRHPFRFAAVVNSALDYVRSATMPEGRSCRVESA